jgi:hypothetical protein
MLVMMGPAYELGKRIESAVAALSAHAARRAARLTAPFCRCHHRHRMPSRRFSTSADSTREPPRRGREHRWGVPNVSPPA